MNKGARFREQVLDEVFFGDPIRWTVPGGAFELSLHTAEPEDDLGRLVAEVMYPGYQRVRLGRDRLTFSRLGNEVMSRIDARFALCQTGPRLVASHWALTPSGDAVPTYRGELDKPLTIEPGIRPVVDAGMIKVREK
jgi:hypothetical protein